MNKAVFSQYTVDYISGAMSLRTPQKESLSRLDNILNNVILNKPVDLQKALKIVNSLYPTCTDFERSFMSVTFALATGVGKTRLMGAFITYLYTQKNVHNFFVVAPGTTIYEKLINDLGNETSSKYVFKGVGCFVNSPNIITGNNYLEHNLFNDDVNIYIFNIDKFNKEDAKMRSKNERFGMSFIEKLASLPDLVLIMDESHHYRAEQGAAALDDLNPIMGLELTATPVVMENNTPILFKNVVYEYPLSKAIADGYTRTPFAMARADMEAYNFGDEDIDKLMLNDGISQHEKYKKVLKVYADNHKKPIIKPFAMVVCKNTKHADWVLNYIKSDSFFEGRYKNKTIVVHSNQKGAEAEENMRALLSVERSDNPIEIVIHVDKLKEGWDVNNLYTIIPLRTAASKVLREQMVGRGLRLPYGERTNDSTIDSVMLTAHDKFQDIIEEAKRGDSIFKAGNIITIPKEEATLKVTYSQYTLNMGQDTDLDEAYQYTGLQQSTEMDDCFQKIDDVSRKEISKAIDKAGQNKIDGVKKIEIVQNVSESIENDTDLSEIYKHNKNSLFEWIEVKIDNTVKEAANKYIPIPKIKITDNGIEEYRIVDFDLDTDEFNHVPTENEIIIQNLQDMSDRRYLTERNSINFAVYNPAKELLSVLCKKPEIDYDTYSELIQKLILTAINHYKIKFDEEKMKNIVMMNKNDISQRIYNQIMKHFYYGSGLLNEEVVDVSNSNIKSCYHYEKEINLYDNFEAKEIRKILFTGIKYGVFDRVKFDSTPERDFAIILEQESCAGTVLNWLRPAPLEFNITYNRGQRYEPDFVVETDNTIYLVEVKGEDKINDPDVIAKKERSVKYCETVTAWSKANGYKPWKHLFIPANQIKATSTFKKLVAQFIVE